MKTTAKEPKQKRAVKKREDLINAALELFLERGFYDTNSKEIAKKAKVSIGLFYNYFNDKSDIFLEILKRIQYNNYIELKVALNAVAKEENKKEILRRYIIQGVKSLSEMFYLYQDIEVIKKHYPKIGDAFSKSKELSKNLLINFLENVNKHESLKISHIKSSIITTTITANCFEIAKIDNEEKQKEVIEILLNLIYDFLLGYI